MNRTERSVGIFGGTFDPPHRGHAMVAKAALDHLGLGEVLFSPAPCPPHKNTTWATFEDRCRMVELLVESEPRFELFPVERELQPPHYTVRTLEHLGRGVLEGVQISLIIGADSLQELHTWREYRRLFELAQLVVVSRPGYPLDRHGLEPELAQRVVRIEDVAAAVSSTTVRAALVAGDAPEEVPANVLDFIRARGLYRTPPAAGASPPGGHVPGGH